MTILLLFDCLVVFFKKIWLLSLKIRTGFQRKSFPRFPSGLLGANHVIMEDMQNIWLIGSGKFSTIVYLW